MAQRHAQASHRLTVPIGYLLSTGVVALCTLIALKPPRPKRSSPSHWTYWLGFLVNELPFFAFAWLVLWTVQAIDRGDLGSPLGWAGLVVAALAALGLAVLARRGLRAGAAIDDALRSAPGARRRRGSRLARAVLMPFPLRPRDVERVSNISYGDAGRWNTLDVYRHRSRPAACPTLIHLHGGTFRSGRKSNEARPLLHRLARRGWICISANYRLSPAARFPDHLIDVKRVIAWVREHGEAYGADPSTVIVAGSSAGGHLASIAALTPNEPRFQPGFEHADTSVSAAVSLYGYYGRLHRFRDPAHPAASSPRDYVRADAPPFFVAHGDQDTIVLVEDARAFVEGLRRDSVSPVVYAELPGAQHTFDLFYSLRCEEVVDGIEDFADWVRASA